MAYASVQMFMEKLKQLINCNDNRQINHWKIKRERPQFQLLYDELGHMIETLFIDQHQDLHDLEKLKDLKQRFICAAEEAQYVVDLFLSLVHIRNNRHLHTYKRPLNIDVVMGSFKSLFQSCVPIRRNNEHFLTHPDFKLSLNLDDIRSSFKSVEVEFMSMKMLSSERIPIQSTTAPNSISGKKLSDEIVVGLDRDVELIRNKLVPDRPTKVDVVSVVGLEKASDSQLREMVHKRLMGRRYLIVLDDIWDSLKLLFPHDNIGSRILITSRLTEVALHANSDGFIHHLGYLNKEKGWELLCRKVFHGNECPKWSIKPGMQIVENCQGLPLVIVVIAGVLAKEAWSENFWVEMAETTGSYIVGEENGCLETLTLSYSHLLVHLRECFLYLSGFPEDYRLKVKKLTWLWMAEGFIEEDVNRRLEDIAEGYLMDLIDRNLVIVAERKRSNGGVRICKVHDLVRELCLKIAREERFILETPHKSVRKFINTNEIDLSHPSTHNLLSILCFSDFTLFSDFIAKYFRAFVLLRVLDLQKCKISHFPHTLELLVHLRYLAIWNSSSYFPSSICNLWNLQTLIYKSRGNGVVLASNISNLVNLRHLRSLNWQFDFGYIEKPMNLQTLSHVRLKDMAHSFQNYFTCVKKLTCTTESDKHNDFKSFTNLEKLTLWGYPMHGKNNFTFPATLKTLTLAWCRLSWGEMSIIHSIPNLEALKLRSNAFVGSCWNTNSHEFQQLKFLRLRGLDIIQWEVYCTSFPSLKRLEILFCDNLEEIPIEIGDIPTLECIQIRLCSRSVRESVTRIQQEQQDMGNYALKIDVNQQDMLNYQDSKSKLYSELLGKKSLLTESDVEL